ncbi:MAG TPA: site-2 protease family protein [Terracidiphilus sp.]|nr:site-2 protease family protein [Terracidiphilus sp.]
MPTLKNGSLHLTRVAGIDLYLHWSWFVVAIIEVEMRRGDYRSVIWNVLEYLALFGIVVVHEFGHALACRQVGGRADTIMLWPLGGVAYVDPPPRPGPVLWSIAAGPLVNVALMPVLGGAWFAARSMGLAQTQPDFYTFLVNVAWINVILLAFNILPVYPLDGGKILWALLWFWLGKGRSLLVSAWIGVAGTVGLLLLGLWWGSIWTILIAAYLLMSCWQSIKVAREMVKLEQMPRHAGFKCPSCGMAPPIGPLWRCDLCGGRFDTFASGAVCPHCNARHPETMCPDCRHVAQMAEWGVQPAWTKPTVIEGEVPRG